MRQVSLRGLRARKLRSSLTVIAIVLGVAMIVGSLVLTDQINNAFSNIFLQVRKTTDVVITKKATFTSDSNGQSTVAFQQSLLDQVRRVPGVSQADGTVGSDSAFLITIQDGKPKPVRPIGGAPALANSASPPPFRITTLKGGRYPQASGEIAVDDNTAKRAKVTVGQTVGLGTATGVRPVKVVGLYHFAGSTGGSTGLLTTLADGQDWFDEQGKFNEIDVKGASGVSHEQLRDRVQAALPGYTVRTGVEQAKKEAADIGSFIDVIGYALTAFGFIAVFVGGFIIFNTFSITVGQRIKEFAMLRTLGASRRQILGSVLLEALLIGVAASIVGVAAGYGIAKLLSLLFDAIGFGLPIAAMRLVPTAIVVAMIVGIGVTLVASLFPAIRATRIPPVAAMRDGAQLPAGWVRRHARWITPFVVVLGLLLVYLGLFQVSGTANALLTLGGGAIVTLLGVAMLAPFVVPPLARLIGFPLVRIGGMPGRIARENAERNPGRTAVTAAAMMIGLSMVTLGAVFAAGLDKTITDTLSSDIKAGLLVSTGNNSGNSGGLPVSFVQDLQKVDGVKEVAPTASIPVRYKGSTNSTQTALSSAVPAFIDAYKLEWKQGNDAVVANLGSDGAIVTENFAKDQRLRVGSTFQLTSQEGRTGRFTLRGIAKGSQIIGGVLASPEGFHRLATKRTLDFAFVVTKPGADTNTVKARLTAIAERVNPLIDVQSNQDVINQARSQINSLLAGIYALLGVAVVISLFGIVNTLLLSVLERTREIGLLRAIGGVRRQVRRMVRYESVITAVMGAVLGIAVGLIFGAMLLSRLDGIAFAVPYGQLVVFLILAVVAGVVSAIIPARRAAKLNVLDALHYE